MSSTRRTRRLCWSTEKCTCRVYCRRSRHDGAATRSRKGVGVYSTLTSCSPPVSSMLTTTTTTKSWRSDTLIILPGWECHTGGSRSKPTVHRCSQSGRRLWVARQVHNHEPNGSAAVQQCQQKKVLPGLFLGCALYAGGIWKGDVLIADLEELETMDASEIYSKRLNAKEVIFPKQGEFIFPIADGRIKPLEEIRN